MHEKSLVILGLGKHSLDIKPKAGSIEEKIDKLDFIKIKNLHSLKYTVKRIKRQATEWEKILVNHISDKELVSRIYKELWALKKNPI